MKASIIIPTCNRADQLSRTLDSVLSIDFDRNEYEVIVIDNGSTDHTRSVVEQSIADHPEHTVRYIYDAVPGLLTGRHRGAKEATSDILVFIDDDIAAAKGWLSAIVDTFQKFPHVHLVGGKCLPKYEKEPPQWIDAFWNEAPGGGRYMGELSLCDLGDEPKEIDPMFVWGLNFSIRKQSLYELGGFHPDNIPPQFQQFQGDGETGVSLAMKARGFSAFYHPLATVYHEVPAERMTIGYFDRRFFYQGISNSFTDLRVKHGSEIVKADISLIEILKKVYRNTVRIFKKKPENPGKNAVAVEHTLLLHRFRAMESAGYQFHQSAAQNSETIMEWVTRKDYFDYHLPSNSVANKKRIL